MIEAGKLEGMREAIGGDRDRFLVRLDASETPQDASGEASDTAAPIESIDALSTPHVASAAITGLLAELREMRRQHASERAADASRIAELEREAGAAGAGADASRRDADRERARADALTRQTVRQAVQITRLTNDRQRIAAERDAAEARAADLEARLAARRWYDPRTW